MEGWRGWDEYAPFYDWENARTLGRRDVAFWRRFALDAPGHVLELGCGTGRITLPLGRAGVRIVGIDRSAPMLARARQRLTRAGLSRQIQLIRGDIRHLPFSVSAFTTVLAPYGVLQSLLRERDLAATLDAVRRALRRGGAFGLELVADLPAWEEYRRRMSLRGWRRRGGAHVTLVETVRQDRARRLTIFDQEFTERHGRHRRTSRFALTFRTLSVPQTVRRLEKAGFAVTALLGDYRGGPWDPRAEVWMILARKT
ncbi:MAG TPA: class I SAM-dependent methyltransferase [Vicinamibacterales bacterium]